MKIHVVIGEHWEVPGTLTWAHRTRAGAEKAAAEMVNLLLRDTDAPQDATPENWIDRLNKLPRGAEVFVIETELEG